MNDMTKLSAAIDSAFTPNPRTPLDRCRDEIRQAIKDALDDYAFDAGWDGVDIEAVVACAASAIHDWNDENQPPNWTEADL